MSRVFVSSTSRDRAVGERVSGLLHKMGDEPIDDRDEANGTAWWNEVVGRIEKCEVFVALVSPAYADAHACRLAAKHAAATGLPVVRLDLGDKPPTTGLHPVVKMASPVRFDPDDPDAPEVLEQALDDALERTLYSDERALSRVEDEPAPPPAPPPPPPPAPVDEDQTGFSGLDLALAAACVLMAVALLMVEGRAVKHIVDRIRNDEAGHGTGQVHTVTTSTVQISGQPSSGAPSQAAESPTGTTDQQVLSAIAAVGSDRLPVSSCAAGDGHVTCRDPAANIGTVVLTPYPSQEALYDAYEGAVSQLAGDPVPENVGDCIGTEFEGEISWNLDLGHGRDISIEEQAGGGLDPATEAAGRLFCTEASDVVRLVWTQDPGLLLTATGQPARLTIGWWHELHMELACAAGGTGAGCEAG